MTNKLKLKKQKSEEAAAINKEIAEIEERSNDLADKVGHDRPAPVDQPKLDQVARTYVKIRDKRKELKKEYDAVDAELKSQLDTLGAFLLETLKNLGVESARTKYGTAFRSIDVKASCQDWNAFYEWIAANEAFDALEKRVKQSFITTYMEDNAGEIPPGITVLQEYTVTVRRS